MLVGFIQHWATKGILKILLLSLKKKKKKKKKKHHKATNEYIHKYLHYGVLGAVEY